MLPYEDLDLRTRIDSEMTVNADYVETGNGVDLLQDEKQQDKQDPPLKIQINKPVSPPMQEGEA